MRRLRFVTLVVIACALVAALAHARDGRFGDRLRARLAARRAEASVPARDPHAPVTAPGDYRFTIRHDGLDRRYRVHVPTSYRPGRPMPMLVALHGGGGDMDWQADDARYGLIGASERHGFIAVFPNGTSPFAGGRLATWTAGRCCGHARDRGVDDVGFIRAVVANVASQLDVDRDRIYATGMSNGGLMAYRLACEAADIFRAIAPVAGTDNTQQCTPSRAVAVLHIHARDDDHVLFDGGAGAGAFRNRDAVTEFTSVPTTIASWVERDACRTPARRVLEVPGAYCEVHDGCREGARVQLCVTARGGHSWPGGRKDRGAPPSTAIDANETMWAFFDALPRRVANAR